jgi:hypothetical protein
MVITLIASEIVADTYTPLGNGGGLTVAFDGASCHTFHRQA